MKDNIIFRDATVEDLPIIVDIYNSTIQSRMVTADTEPISINDRVEWLNKHTHDKRPLWVVEYEGKDCGWVSFQSFYGRPAYNGTVEVSIYFHKDFRGQGLGKKTLAKVIEACPKYEIETLLGFIFAHNEPSIKLFTSFGFERWGHLPEVAKLDGIKKDLLIFGRRIR